MPIRRSQRLADCQSTQSMLQQPATWSHRMRIRAWHQRRWGIYVGLGPQMTLQLASETPRGTASNWRYIECIYRYIYRYRTYAYHFHQHPIYCIAYL